MAQFAKEFTDWSIVISTVNSYEHHRITDLEARAALKMAVELRRELLNVPPLH